MSEQNVSIFKLIDLIQKIYYQKELDPFISLVQSDSRILLYLSSHDNVHPSELSKELNMSRPNITANLQALENDGLIVRVINPKNRREILVSLTDSGRERFGEIIGRLMLLFKEWLDLLGPELTEHVIEILEISSKPENIGPTFMSLYKGNN